MDVAILCVYGKSEIMTLRETYRNAMGLLAETKRERGESILTSSYDNACTLYAARTWRDEIVCQLTWTLTLQVLIILKAFLKSIGLTTLDHVERGRKGFLMLLGLRAPRLAIICID